MLLLPLCVDVRLYLCLRITELAQCSGYTREAGGRGGGARREGGGADGGCSARLTVYRCSGIRYQRGEIEAVAPLPDYVTVQVDRMRPRVCVFWLAVLNAAVSRRDL